MRNMRKMDKMTSNISRPLRGGDACTEEAPMDHEYYMRQALALAEEAMEAGEVPVGCVIVWVLT